MNSVILCEGFDDILILGYYLHKTSKEPKWNYVVENEFSEYFKLPNVSKRQTIEIYKRNEDKVAIWGVGGKDRFNKVLHHIYKINTSFPQERFKEVILVSDRDSYEINDCLKKIENDFSNIGWDVTLSNNISNKVTYEVEEEFYDINITPIVIPFEEIGALETVLMNAIAETDIEDNYIVGQAKEYITKIKNSGNLAKYLRHDRERLKAEFSAVISVTNPDRSTALFDALLMSHEWETKAEIKKHFGIIEELLNNFI